VLYVDPLPAKPRPDAVVGELGRDAGLGDRVVRTQAQQRAEVVLGGVDAVRVEKVGSSVQNVKPGDRVMVPFNIYCGSCYFCARGLYSNCAVMGRLPRTAARRGSVGLSALRRPRRRMDQGRPPPMTR
jgi:Zn-dependent alcohol dehydrogenase